MGRKRSHGPYRYLGRILGLYTFVRYCAANLHVIGLFDASITSPCWRTEVGPPFSSGATLKIHNRHVDVHFR
ncbi:hypothetical protein BHM03_00014078 [Ensete ventricosum]|nr:hypothetical protein BHM03_00014078 [Ensete ventricosum]